jgi:hypothetical protein
VDDTAFVDLVVVGTLKISKKAGIPANTGIPASNGLTTGGTSV